MKPSLLTVIFLSACVTLSRAQKTDSLQILKASLDSLDAFFTHEDSLDIFALVDSLLKLEDPKPRSMMAARLGYNSNIIADASAFNIQKFGLAPGLSYYHKSGAYADVSSYWSQEYDPNFYLTVTSAGYMHTFKKWYSLLAEYSHYFYHPPSDTTITVPYTNNLGLTNYFEIKWLILRLDYYFYFGDKTAHRLMPGLGFNLVKKKWLGFDRVAFYPTASILFGSEETTYYELAPNILLRILYNRNHPTSRLPLVYEKTRTEFGAMNYSFIAPVSFTKKNWTFMLGYTYNIPKSLTGENVSLQNSGYMSFSITRYFDF